MADYIGNTRKISDKKILLWIAAGIVVIVLIILVSKKISGLLKKIKENQSVRQTERDIDKGNLTYESQDYSAWADQLFTAMEGWLTNNDVVMSIIGRLKTADDWKKLYATFGLRKSTSWVDGHFEGNLAQWLVDDLGSSEIAKVRGMLSKLGINQL